MSEFANGSAGFAFPANLPRPIDDERIVVLTGAGVSAESGLPTFRGPDGLWEGHRAQEVATPEAWARDPALVRRFYNLRRRALGGVRPNPAHHAIADIQRRWGARLVTQNVDDLHERAGSTNVLHLHGRLTRARCGCGVGEPEKADIGYRELTDEDRCSHGRPLRPDIVWFGEPVPLFEDACAMAAQADWLLVVGTSLTVYPAAALVHEAPPRCRTVLVDTHPPVSIAPQADRVWIIAASAAFGVPRLLRHWSGDSAT